MSVEYTTIQITVLFCSELLLLLIIPEFFFWK